jgi:hypothetical protein
MFRFCGVVANGLIGQMCSNVSSYEFFCSNTVKYEMVVVFVFVHMPLFSVCTVYNYKLFLNAMYEYN